MGRTGTDTVRDGLQVGGERQGGLQQAEVTCVEKYSRQPQAVHWRRERAIALKRSRAWEEFRKHLEAGPPPQKFEKGRLDNGLFMGLPESLQPGNTELPWRRDFAMVTERQTLRMGGYSGLINADGPNLITGVFMSGIGDRKCASTGIRLGPSTPCCSALQMEGGRQASRTVVTSRSWVLRL